MLSDLPALIAMGAQARLAGSTGDRWVALEDFFLGPYETTLRPGELLAELVVPRPPAGAGGCHMKFTIGSPANKPVANVSCFLRLDGGRVAEARIIMGAVGGVPTPARAAAEILAGEAPGDKLIAAAAETAAAEADPIEDLRGPIWYKRRMVRVLVARGVRCALQRAQSPPQGGDVP